MAKTKRKKTNPKPAVKPKTTSVELHPDTLKKLLDALDPGSNAFEKLTKRHKQVIFNCSYYRPAFRIEKESRMPRQFVKHIREEIYEFLETETIGEGEQQITYMEYVTFAGAVLFFSDAFSSADDMKATKERVLETVFKYSKEVEGRLSVIIDYLVIGFSKISFRHYGFRIDSINEAPKWVIEFSSLERKEVRLIRDGKYRPAFASFSPRMNKSPFKQQTIHSSKVDPELEPQELPIFIQPHASFRLNERLDIFQPIDRNYMMSYSLGEIQDVAREHSLIALSNKDSKPLGYFPYAVQDNNFYVLSFLPLTSPSTPEGERLHKELRLGKKDLIYLGLDKLSFLYEVDFEQIPALKEALIRTGIWEIRDSLLDDPAMLREGYEIINEERTRFLKSFFEKQALYGG